MIGPVLLALAAPPAFVQAVEKKLASTHMHLVDWWADDLDGDRMAESIALMCNDDSGSYVVQHGTQLLEMPAPIDGRNPCPDDVTHGPPAWHVEHAAAITYHFNVHHGGMQYVVAIRDGRFALLREHDDSIDVDSSGTTREVDDVDYEALTWTSVVTPPHSQPTRSSGPMVIMTDHVRRPTKLVGATTIAATRGADDAITLHVHADRVLSVRACTDEPCAPTRVAKGDSDLTTAPGDEIVITAGGTTIHVHVQAADGDQSYPTPPPPM